MTVTFLLELSSASREKALDAPLIMFTRHVSMMGNLSML